MSGYQILLILGYFNKFFKTPEFFCIQCCVSFQCQNRFLKTSNCWSTTVVYCILNSILTDKLVILFALFPPAPLPPQQLFFILLCPALASLSSVPELPCFQLYEGFSQCEALKRSEHRRERSLTVFSPIPMPTLAQVLELAAFLSSQISYLVHINTPEPFSQQVPQKSGPSFIHSIKGGEDPLLWFHSQVPPQPFCISWLSYSIMGPLH